MASAFPVCSTSVRNSPARATISLPATIAVSTCMPLVPASSPTASTTGTIDAPEWARNVQSSHSRRCARKLFALAAWRAARPERQLLDRRRRVLLEVVHELEGRRLTLALGEPLPRGEVAQQVGEERGVVVRAGGDVCEDVHDDQAERGAVRLVARREGPAGDQWREGRVVAEEDPVPVPLG